MERFYRTASGECTLGGGAWHFLRLCQFLNGRLTGVRKVLCRAGQIGCKGHHDFYLGSDGGFMILEHSKIGQTMEINFKNRCVGTEEKDSFQFTLKTTSSIST